MDKQFLMNLDEELVEQANEILENWGLDFQGATKMFLKRVIKEDSISFLFPQKQNTSIDTLTMEQNNAISTVYIPQKEDKGDMTKSKAVRLFASKGFYLGRSVTFASKNRGAYNYWANVEFDMLNIDWYLILNDWVDKTIYLFFIPANSIEKRELTPRSDKPFLIDLQIMYKDTTFTDNRSGYSFAKYLKDEIKY